MARRKSSNWGYVLSVLVLLFLGLTSGALFFSRIMAKSYVVSGVYVGGRDLSGKTYEQANQEVYDSSEGILDQVVSLKLNDITREVALRDLGVKFDEEETFKRIVDVSYGRNIVWHAKARFLGMSGKRINVKPVIEINSKDFVEGVRKLFPEIKSPRDARVVVDAGGNVNVYGHEFGVAADYDSAYADLKQELEMGEFDDIDLKFRLLRVGYLKSEAEEDAKILEGILGKSVFFVNADEGFRLEKKIPADWVQVYKGQIDFSENRIAAFITQEIEPEIGTVKSDLEILELPEGEVGYAKVDGEVRDGKVVKVSTTIDGLVRALTAGADEVKLDVIETKGGVVNKTGVDLGDLKFLTSGRSNFKGSTAGRDFNVRKGIDEKMNDIVVAPGATFSFNSFLGPVTYAAGWKDALAIFNGEDLEPVPGGGLCQVSTTVYRAALNAGLDVVEQRNHSLYVHYYKEYGNGLDATIYPGQQDLKFVNNTGNYLFIRSWTDGDDAYVDFYGTDDGRKVELVGPIYKGEVPADYQDKINLGSTQIAWIHKVTWPDGKEVEEILKSSYRNAIMR